MYNNKADMILFLTRNWISSYKRAQNFEKNWTKINFHDTIDKFASSKARKIYT